MAKLINKLKDILLGVDTEEDLEDEYLEEISDKKERITKYDKQEKIETEISNFQPRIERGSKVLQNPRSLNSNIVDLHKKIEVNICSPKNIEDARNIIDNTKYKIISIVNLEGVDTPVAQRIADFLSGSVDALDGNIRRLSNVMFVIAPSGVDISGNMYSNINKELKSNEKKLSWASGSFI